MEKTLKLTWSEVLKWLVLIVGIATTYGVMQYKVVDLEQGRKDNARDIQHLEERMRVQEAQVAKINQKLDLIGDDVTVIKNAILNNSLDPRGR